jgi:hypothetical protein
MAADYILRLIRQMAMLVANIIAKRQAGQLDAAGDEIEAKCLQATGLPLVVVKQSTTESLAELLAAGGALQIPRAIALAELLIQDGEIALSRGNPPGAALSFRHAAALLSNSIDALGEEEQRHYRARLALVAERLRDVDGGLEV